MTPHPFDDGRQQPGGTAGENRSTDAAFMIVDDHGTVVRVTGWDKAFGIPAPERIEAGEERPDRLVSCLAEAIEEAATTGGLARRTVSLGDSTRIVDVAAASLAVGGGGASTAIMVELRGEVAGGRAGGEGKAIRELEHDLRSPLTSISGAAELLESGRLGAMSGQQTKCLGVIQKGVDGMLSLLEAAAAPYRKTTALKNAPVAPPDDDGKERTGR